MVKYVKSRTGFCIVLNSNQHTDAARIIHSTLGEEPVGAGFMQLDSDATVLKFKPYGDSFSLKISSNKLDDVADLAGPLYAYWNRHDTFMVVNEPIHKALVDNGEAADFKHHEVIPYDGETQIMGRPSPKVSNMMLTLF